MKAINERSYAKQILNLLDDGWEHSASELCRIYYQFSDCINWLQKQGYNIECREDPYNTRQGLYRLVVKIIYNGSGTQEDPYQIATLAQLQGIRYHLSSHFVLVDNIDATDTVNWNDGQGFVPIGNYDNKFTGNFDGRGHSIKNLYINRPNTLYVGFFSYAQNAEIKKTRIVKCLINGESFVGGLVGHTYNTTITDSYVTGSVSGGDFNRRNFVGGLVGYVHASTIKNSYFKGKISGSKYPGELVGGNWNSTVNGKYVRRRIPRRR